MAKKNLCKDHSPNSVTVSMVMNNPSNQNNVNDHENMDHYHEPVTTAA